LNTLPKHAESSWGSINTRKLLIGGNWKCFDDKDFLWSFPYTTLHTSKFDPNLLDVIVAPGYLHLWEAKNLIKNDV
jgi:hypothetical protein